MRNSKRFHELLLQYEATSVGKRTQIFWEMKSKAKTFADWDAVYQYAGSSLRKDAQREMERLVLKGDTTSDIQLNILELFMIIDEADKSAILSMYVKKHHGKDDLLFALSEADWSEDGLLVVELWNKLEAFYKASDGIKRGLNARHKRSKKLLEKSTFNP